ncbi:hypothetical protein AURDEDRAFT_184879 [Auricularia subglabra TFB-10046 SS5]|nr:hypothetical protein AURDEDRAFT_184879 [Auricularia subglabra TFB-10046 SS5]
MVHGQMTPADALPDYVATSLSQSVSRAVEAAIQDPTVYASCDLISAKLAAVRRCVENAISTVLAARNPTSGLVDIWRLVWAYLPIRDLLSVTHVCRRWREVALNDPALWTLLEVHAWDGDGTAFFEDEPPTLSNLGVLVPVLPRSKAMDVTIEVDIRAFNTTREFHRNLTMFLSASAPRIKVLRVLTADALLPRYLFESNDFVFPRLQTLALFERQRDADYAYALGEGFLFDCRSLSLPSLSHLHVDSKWRLVYARPFSTLARLVCTVDRMQDVVPLLLSSPRLGVVVIKCRAPTLDVDATPEHAHLLAALYAIPEICITTPRDPFGEERVFRVFANSPRRRLSLDFDCAYLNYAVPFQPQQCAALASATELTLSRRTDRAVVIDAADAAHPERVRKIALTNPPMWTQVALTIDWARIATLNDLLSLRVDAKLWSTVMVNFPAVPQLSRVTLKLVAAADLDYLIAAQPIPVLPAVVPITIASDTPISVDSTRVDALKQALGAVKLTVENISLG